MSQVLKFNILLETGCLHRAQDKALMTKFLIVLSEIGHGNDLKVT